MVHWASMFHVEAQRAAITLLNARSYPCKPVFLTNILYEEVESMLSRRHFIRVAASLGGATLFSLNQPRWWRFLVTANAQEPSSKELYAGFVLLSEAAPVPDFVRESRGIVLDQECDCQDPALAGETVQFDGIQELSASVSIPLYVPTALPRNARLAHTSVTRFVESGDVWEIAISFATGDARGGSISVRASPEFPQPYPVWPVRLWFAHDDGPIYPEKVTISGSPGVMLPSARGYVFLWIERGVLYTLAVEDYSDRDTATATADSLAQAK